MKKIVTGILSAALLLALCCGCGGKDDGGERAVYDTPEALGAAYLTAVKDRDYQAIRDMLPEEFWDYALESGMVRDENEILAFIQYELGDSYMPDGVNAFSLENFRIDGPEAETWTDAELQNVREYIKDETDRYVQVNDVCMLQATLVMADGSTESLELAMIKGAGGWYMTSVTGDDDILD